MVNWNRLLRQNAYWRKENHLSPWNLGIYKHRDVLIHARTLEQRGQDCPRHNYTYNMIKRPLWRQGDEDKARKHCKYHAKVFRCTLTKRESMSHPCVWREQSVGLCPTRLATYAEWSRLKNRDTCFPWGYWYTIPFLSSSCKLYYSAMK